MVYGPPVDVRGVPGHVARAVIAWRQGGLIYSVGADPARDHRPVDRVYPLRISACYWPGWPVRVIRAKAGLLLVVPDVVADRIVLGAAGPARYAQTIPDEQAGTGEHELLAAERSEALREAFLQLPLSCRRLITMLTEDPPAPYAQISAKLGIPVASIGPTRSRCLDELRRHPAIAALINAEAQTGRRDAGPGPVRPQR